ncbi:MAG: helix-turn-helix transcriptional regulator [Methanosarcina vacuolata]|jgi:DNA-binding transcriptional ArsR family regulator|nr:helix-turn-helix transcriptional regulator [Methanosarcina vacuolata]
MSLADFLGSTSEIKIIDFLVENMDMAYNQTEISECLGMSRTIVNQKIPLLIYNHIIEVKECKGNSKKYGLKDNSLVHKLITLIYDHSFKMSEYEEDEGELLSRITDECPISYEEECDIYCGENRNITYSQPSTSNINYNECKYKPISKWKNMTSVMAPA